MESFSNRERYINFYTDFAFKRLFGTEVNKDLQEYEESLKAYRDWYSVTKTSFDKGVAEGIQQGRAEGRAEGLEEGLTKGREKESIRIAKNLKAIGTDLKLISDVTGLSISELEHL